MDLICPECRGTLQMDSAQTAVCAQHGGRFDVLFDRAAAPAPAPVVAEAVITEPVTSRTRAVAKCFDHPENDSVASCRLCAKPICATCDFVLPGGVHLCPVCIENSQSSEEVSPKRKKLTYIALACAIWSTILFLLTIVGAFNELFTDDAAGKGMDLIITNITLWPLLIGTGLAMSANERRLKRTGLMKLVLWWNGILGAIFLVIVVAANLGILG